MSRGQLSIDVLVEVSIRGNSQLSVDRFVLLSIDAVHLSLRIVRSKRAESENSSAFFLLVLVLLGVHLKEIKKKIY